MGDLFHPEVPDSFLQQVFQVMEDTPQHTYLVLTKRSVRMRDYFIGSLFKNLPPKQSAPKNVWLGASLEDTTGRLFFTRFLPIAGLLATANLFLSLEPLLNTVDLYGAKETLGWVIVGGESGPKARPTNPDWVRHIRDQCVANNVPFFFKQWGTWGPDGIRRNAKANGALLDGREWRQFPDWKRLPIGFDNTNTGS